MNDRTDLIAGVGRKVHLPSRRQPDLPARPAHLPPGRHPELSPQDQRYGAGYSVVADAAAIATLRANLHELAADFHELAASIHDMAAEQHAQALLHGFGDPILHRQCFQWRRARAAAERASAEKERRAGEQDRTRPALRVG